MLLKQIYSYTCRIVEVFKSRDEKMPKPTRFLF